MLVILDQPLDTLSPTTSDSSAKSKKNVSVTINDFSPGTQAALRLASTANDINDDTWRQITGTIFAKFQDKGVL